MKLSKSPTVQTVVILTVLFGLKQLLIFADIASLNQFTAALPATEPLWAIPLSTYSHFTITHLIGNLVFLVAFGLLVEQSSTQLKFHSFFLSVGMIAGLSHIYLTSFIGEPKAVIGASGAVFGLIGYAISSNVVIDKINLSKRQSSILFVFVALVLTVILGGEGSAHIAHFTGIILGLICGHWNILRAD